MGGQGARAPGKWGEAGEKRVGKGRKAKRIGWEDGVLRRRESFI